MTQARARICETAALCLSLGEGCRAARTLPATMMPCSPPRYALLLSCVYTRGTRSMARMSERECESERGASTRAGLVAETTGERWRGCVCARAPARMEGVSTWTPLLVCTHSSPWNSSVVESGSIAASGLKRWARRRGLTHRAYQAWQEASDCAIDILVEPGSNETNNGSIA
jgi:hypothetical protein